MRRPFETACWKARERQVRLRRLHVGARGSLCALCVDSTDSIRFMLLAPKILRLGGLPRRKRVRWPFLVAIVQ